MKDVYKKGPDRKVEFSHPLKIIAYQAQMSFRKIENLQLKTSRDTTGRLRTLNAGAIRDFAITYQLLVISYHQNSIPWYNSIRIKNACVSRLATGQETAAVPSDLKVWMCERMLSKQGFCFYLNLSNALLSHKPKLFLELDEQEKNDQG